MTEPELNKLIKAHRITGRLNIKALRLHLVKGLHQAEAARRAGMRSRAGLCRAVKIIGRPVCGKCGEPIRK